MPETLPNVPDPVTPPVDKPKDTPPPVVTKAGIKEITQQEYDSLMKRAGNYDAIESDPDLSMKVIDHLRGKTGSIGQRQPPAPVKTTNDTVEDPRFKALNDTVNNLTRQLASQEIRAFRQSHPDMDEYKDDMTALVQRGIPLEDAYRFSKAAKSQSSQKPAGNGTPATPTAETNRDAGIPEGSDATRNEVMRKINDPKATPRMDDALDLAFAEAKRQHAAQ